MTKLQREKKELLKIIDEYNNGNEKNLQKYIAGNYVFFNNKRLRYTSKLFYSSKYEKGYVEFAGNNFCFDKKVPSLMYIFDSNKKLLREIDLSGMWESIENIYE